MASLLATGPVTFHRIAATTLTQIAAAEDGKKKRLLGLAGHAGAAGATFYIASGVKALTGTMTVAANGPIVWPQSITGYCETLAGGVLNIAVTAGAVNGCAVVQTVV